ncbi:MAG: DUF3293 domain-containing protein [Zoogloeaceae bacterium]|jgi:hypothetical protein|nr:DUF3293 domain-containing protein [Zoogloeaceae bacterium]
MDEDRPLHSAYRATRYAVFPAVQEAERVWVLGVDCAVPPALEAWLQAAGFCCWSLVSACNPASCLLSAEENVLRQTRLREDLQGAGWRWFFGMNYAGEGSHWPPEMSFWIPGMARESAMRLARSFGQNAFLCGTAGSRARLVWISPC